MCLLSLTLVLAMSDAQSPIQSDETVLFFPTYGQLNDAATHWVLPVHGWIFESESNGLVRGAALSLFRRGLGLEKEKEDTAIFLQRARRFIVDNERGKQLTIQLGPRAYRLEESGANGHFAGEIQLPVAEANLLLAEQGNRRKLTFRAVVPAEDKRVFAGVVHLLTPSGVSVVSDIDDTVKVSQVRDRRALLNNTFIRPFEAAPGMSELYRTWEQQGATFHFVSSSPWQLYEPLAEFFEAEKFPSATWHMKSFRWKDSSFFDLLESPEASKPKSIEPLMRQYPKRQFILVGDSGEKDPEVYGAMARKYPDQVLRILIRNVTEEDAAGERMQQAFHEVPAARWQMFTLPGELPPIKWPAAK